ncbi:uncharacterized protein BDR25DRAFT_310766 [Lindgomyces ingoldianus]|uniref:Uncharacterized protein n=1 Tax=Lindgomyces ingoldianus TaxID=673940 RepID=A0ACB6R7Y9_9PLEO|nr:uncharacterized protein BDR25DRAFT_310766 [Lindgomyces ingoldianus]KAF2475379.1 hypothetical protein BDR25DRAFT_310766 [Lindgomyces ingoldianus]
MPCMAVRLWSYVQNREDAGIEKDKVKVVNGMNSKVKDSDVKDYTVNGGELKVNGSVPDDPAQSFMPLCRHNADHPGQAATSLLWSASTTSQSCLVPILELLLIPGKGNSGRALPLFTIATSNHAHNNNNNRKKSMPMMQAIKRQLTASSLFQLLINGSGDKGQTMTEAMSGRRSFATLIPILRTAKSIFKVLKNQDVITYSPSPSSAFIYIFSSPIHMASKSEACAISENPSSGSCIFQKTEHNIDTDVGRENIGHSHRRDAHVDLDDELEQQSILARMLAVICEEYDEGNIIYIEQVSGGESFYIKHR